MKLEECEDWIKQTQKNEMKNKISFALKDPILQQGFELICKDLAGLEKENAELKLEVKALEEIEELEKESAELKNRISNWTTELNELKTGLNELKSQIEKEKC